MLGKIWGFLRSLGRVADTVKKSEEVFVEDSVYETRRQTCETCPVYKENFDMCGECYCVINIKARLSTEKCPLGKW